jgi:hypothetical protein
MRQLFFIFSLAIGVMAMNACKDDSTNMRRKITGKAGEVVVVVPNDTWDGEVGKSFREVMAQPNLGLPQDEPIFDLVNIPPTAFTDIFKSSRNIVRINISSTVDTAKVEFKKDMWAWPQAIVDIAASSPQEFTGLFRKNSDQIVAFLLRAERDRLLLNYEKFNEVAVKKAAKDQFDIKLNVPPGFIVSKQADDFLWVRYETPEISQGIIIHTYPYTSDSTFTRDYLTNRRNDILKARVEGPATGSYMTTEDQLVPEMNIFQFKKNYAAELRGLWRLKGDFMGGPFINLSILDAANNRIVMLDGYVYAPRFDKRNLLRQVEAMLYSMELPDQKKNDKINSQVNMGN